MALQYTGKVMDGRNVGRHRDTWMTSAWWARGYSPLDIALVVIHPIIFPNVPTQKTKQNKIINTRNSFAAEDHHVPIFPTTPAVSLTFLSWVVRRGLFYSCVFHDHFPVRQSVILQLCAVSFSKLPKFMGSP
jgi:hypothetical protein